MKRLSICGLALALLTAGCAGGSSGIQVFHVTDSDAPQTGIPWNLPMTQFTIAITREVVSCNGGITGQVETSVTTSKVLDNQQRYVLYSNGWWSTSDITSNLAPDGSSTGLGAHSEGQAAAVISSVVGTIGNIALTAAAGAAHGVKAIQPRCSKTVADAVNEMYPPGGKKKTLADRVNEDTAALAAATAKVTLLTAQAQADPSYKQALAQALGVQSRAQTRVSTDQESLSKDLKATSDIQTVSWPPQGDQFRTKVPFSIDPDVVDGWKDQKKGGDVDLAQFGVYLALYRQGPDGSWSVPQSSGVGDIAVGVPVRLARTGRLVVCVAKSCPASLPVGWEPTKGNKMTDSDHPVLQLGQMYTVPVVGGAFKSEGATVALDPSTGVPTSIETYEKTAEAATIAGALQNGSSQASALPGQIRAAELSRLQAQTNIAQAKSALATANANLGVQGQVSALAAQTALDQAKTANINAATALANAQASLR